MNETVYFILTLLCGWLGIHKFAKGKIGLGFLYLFTLGLFGIGWFVDIIIAAIDLINYGNKKPSSNSSTGTYYYTPPDNDASQQAANYAALRPYASKYYQGMDNIESMWSVMHNLQIVSGEQADMFVQKCYENLADLSNLLQAERKYGLGGQMPPKVPAYIRLAMLFEKQGRYEDAINICVEAIKVGATNDNSKGKMFGRLARLIKKSGMPVSDDILRLTSKVE